MIFLRNSLFPVINGSQGIFFNQYENQCQQVSLTITFLPLKEEDYCLSRVVWNAMVWLMEIPSDHLVSRLPSSRTLKS